MGERETDPKAEADGGGRSSELQRLILMALEHLDMPIFIKDDELRWRYVNQAACNALGVCEEKLLGHTLYEVLPGDLAALVDSYDKQVLTNGNSVVFDLELDWLGEKKFYVAKKLQFRESCGDKYIIGYLSDITAQKKAELEKKEQEQFYQSLFDSSGASQAIFNDDCVITKCNAQFERLTGYSRQEVQHSMTWKDFVAPCDLERLTGYHERRLDTVDPPPREYELDFLRKNSELRSLHAVLTVIPHSTDRVISLIDITDRKQAEKALEETLNKYRTLIETTDTGYVLFKPDGFVLDANDEYCRLAGRPREMVVGHQGREWILPSEIEGCQAALKHCLDKGKISHFQTCFQHPDGKVVAIESNASFFESKGEPLAMSLVRDISERKKAEDALKESEQRLRSLVDNMPVLILAYDKNGRIIFWNKECERVLGWTAEELMEHPEKSGQLYAVSGYLDRLLEMADTFSGRYCEWEVPMVAKDGEIRMIAWTSRSVDSPLPGWHVWEAGVDVTERRQYLSKLANLNKYLEDLVAQRTQALKQQTDALEIANQKLKEVDACKSSFLNTVSHDIRTPLTSILGFARLIEREFAHFEKVLVAQDAEYGKRADRVTENFKVIHAEGNRLKRLINDFLDLSKIESGQIQWDDRPIDFAELSDRIHRVFDQRNFLDRNIAFTLNFSEEIPPLIMDQDRLLQVLFNLLDNAFKFTRNGRVELRVDATDQQHVRFMVSDTGIGMDKEALANIFSEFYQVYRNDTMEPENRGTGIGLAACRMIVDHYQGRIWAESEVGRGTTVYVIVPCVDNRCILRSRLH